jgi:hypothetical protein
MGLHWIEDLLSLGRILGPVASLLGLHCLWANRYNTGRLVRFVNGSDSQVVGKPVGSCVHSP